MPLRAVRAICFDLDNTLWDVEPVLARAERILSDWLEGRYPKIPALFPRYRLIEIPSDIIGDHQQQANDIAKQLR